ncbi:Actin-related protein 6 [Armadillidium vulgare]|nr:Actin-related protein 6 [Armadillidium vulgare]
MMINAVMKAKSERRRPFIGDQIEECRDASGLFYILPYQKGYLLNFDVQKNIWDYAFGKDVFNLSSNTTVVFTEPLLNFTSIQESTSEVFFEEYEVDALLRINGKKEKTALCRIDIGGKILTNHLKEIISYRQLNVMDETYVINQVKEDSCFVSLDFMADMKITREKNEDNTILRDYVLPDFTTIKRGYVRSREESNGKAPNGEQLIRLNNERFSIPELLFNPSDVGIQEMGISEAIVYCIEKCPEETRPHLYKNILLTGGNCNIPGFRDRVYKDVRSMAHSDYTVNVTLAKNPSTYAWNGGAALSRSSQFPEMLVTRQEWEENGYYICEKKFNI